MIEEYHFGSITIDGKTYQHDIELHWNGEVLEWQRDESHKIAPKDVERAINQEPELIIIGTGESGFAEVLEQTREKILSQGIGLIIKKTKEAVEIFDREREKERKVIGLFHLTC